MSFSSSSSDSVFSATRGDYGAAQIITMYLSAIRKVRNKIFCFIQGSFN